jgi:hypothetical protein
VRGEPRLDHGSAERVRAGPLGHSPTPPARCEVCLLGDPSQHGDAVLERGGVPALGREAVADGDDDGVAEARDAAAEGVVGGAVRGAGHEGAAVELHDHGKPPRGPRSGRREVPAVVGACLGRGGRHAVEAGARAAGGRLLARRGVVGRGEGVAAEGWRVQNSAGVVVRVGEEEANVEGGERVRVEVLGGDAVGDRRGEGRVGGLRGAVVGGAGGDAEGGGGGRRCSEEGGEAAAEEELEEEAVELDGDGGHGHLRPRWGKGWRAVAGQISGGGGGAMLPWRRGGSSSVVG